MSNASSLLPPFWTAIAERARESTTNEMLQWHELAGALLQPSEARILAAKGAIIMAQRYFPDRVELLIRPATDNTGFPKKPATGKHK